MGTPTQSNRPISITTPLGEDVLLLEGFRFRETLGRPFELEAKLQSTDANIDFSKIVGQEVTVTISAMPTYQPRYFHGTVSQFVQTGFTGEFANYRARIVPWIWLLGRASNCRIFADPNQTVPTIVLKVFRDHGFTDVVNSLKATYPIVPFCVQYNETDLDFVSRLMESQGIYYFYQHTASKDTLVLCDAMSTHDSFPGYGQIPYNPSKDFSRGPERIYEWTIEQDVQPGKYWVKDYDYLNPKQQLLEKASQPQDYSHGDLRRYSYPGNFATDSQGSDLATIRLQELQARELVQIGASNVLGIAAGCQFTLTSYPRNDQNTAYLTTGMDLEVTSADFSTADSGQADFSAICRFRNIALTRTFRPPRITPKPCIAGPQTATVAGQQTPSGVSTDQYGNVQVQFHWDLEGTDSCWIRVSQNWAGDAWGGMFIPHVGTEVIVCFENGDPDCPIVVGRVYNGDQKPPIVPSASPSVSYIMDSSTKNLIKMDATENAQIVTLQNAANQIVMNSTTGSESLTITDGKSTMLFQTPQGNVSITNANDVNYLTSGSESWVTNGLSKKLVNGLSLNIYVGGYMSITPLILNFGFVGGIKSQIVLGAELKYNAGNKTELYTGGIYKIIWGDEYKWESKGKKRLSTDCGEVYNSWNLLANTREAIAISERKKTATFTGNYGTRTETVATTDSQTILGSSTETVTGIKDITAGEILIQGTSGTTITSGGAMALGAETINMIGTVVNIN